MVIRIEHMAENTVEAGKKKLYIKSYGCQMNVYDAMRMGDLMRPHGYQIVETVDGADVVVLNTCHIREKADDKVFSDIGRMNHKAADDAIIAVGGCVGQAMGKEVVKRSKQRVEIVFGPQTLHRLPEYVEKARRAQGVKGFKGVVDTEFPELEKFDKLPEPSVTGPTSFVSVQEGCDKFCTYCVVPYTRGAEISRPVEDVVREVATVVSKGAREVTLLGQNVNAYEALDANGNTVTFPQLISRLAQEIDGLWRIRFTTSHPRNMSRELIDLFGSEPKLMPYLHLPVQAGSDKILKAMNRDHTAQSYLDILEELRQVRPDIAFSGDFIVGFPTETEEDFMDTLELVAQVGYQSAYSFAYSPRPGTPAATMPQVPTEDQKERLAGLQALLDDQQLEFNSQFVGQEVEVLVEETAKEGPYVRGRSPHNVAVMFEGDASLIGKLVKVKALNARPKSLDAELVEILKD